MGYFVTGGTGFVGRHLIEELVDHRRGPVFVLVRESSTARFDLLHRTRWKSSKRIRPVVGDPTAPLLGVDPDWAATHGDEVTHFFHLPTSYAMTASTQRSEELTDSGTRAALALATALRVRTLHHMSSVSVAGDRVGIFDETMFDQGQDLPSPYHAAAFEAERIVRDEALVPWRVYRPAIVMGHSETGTMDSIDGPYYFFPFLKRLRDSLPQWAPLMGLDLGDTNVVPVDYVAKSMDHLAHVRGLDGQTFHLASPDPQPTTDVINTFATAAKAPRFAVVVQRRLTSALPAALTPINVLTAALGTPAAQLALEQTIGRLGVPPAVLWQVAPPSTFVSRHTQQALAGSGISCPELEAYAAALWDYWEQHLDEATANDVSLRQALVGTLVVITGDSSGIGRAVALKVSQAGGVPLLVAGGKDTLVVTQAEINAAGAVAFVYPCDLSDLGAIDAVTKKIVAEHKAIDFVVNAACRSISRPLDASSDRRHDVERTMALDYAGAVRLMLGLLPVMRATGAGHLVNVSSIGVQTSPPRSSANVASDGAVDAWSQLLSSELIGAGVTSTTIHLPLVRGRVIAATGLSDAFPTVSPAQAADLVMTALKDKPPEINTVLGTAGEVAHALLPETALRMLQTVSRLFPSSGRGRT
ncbi:MAG: SDR family oxidoreductase [Propionibacteriales bacterium]|nr:SDR family oxidoreductase [Propionibacteriales bacterium]